MVANVAFSMKNNPYTGEEGNRSADHGSHTLAAAAIADTVDLLPIPAGAKLLGLHMINAALGAGATISLGFRNKDGSTNAAASATALLAATAAATAGTRTASVFVPIEFAVDAVLYATVGGAAATGRIDVITDYIYKGML
jgi:hypothetical protein